MTKTRTCFFLLAFMFSSMFTQAQSSMSYKIFSSKLNKEVTLEDIAADMRNYDVLLFGEEHNDSVAHVLQSQLLQLLYKQFPGKLSLSLEMFDRDVQLVMDEYLNDAIRERNFVKDARVWNNYEDYRSMVEFAKAHNMTVICANAPSRYTNLAGRKGQAALLSLSKQARKFIAPLPYETASGKYLQKLMAMTGHAPSTATDTTTKKQASPGPMADFDLIAAQSLWDATMAFSIAEYLKKHKGYRVLQINGRFHSDERFAIVTQLINYSPKTRSLVISAGPDENFPTIDWSKRIGDGDYTIATPPIK